MAPGRPGKCGKRQRKKWLTRTLYLFHARLREAFREEQGLCRVFLLICTFDWKRYAVVDFTPRGEQAANAAPTLNEIEIPKQVSSRSVIFSRALDGIILCPQVYTWEVRGLDGSLKKTIQLDPSAPLAAKG